MANPAATKEQIAKAEKNVESAINKYRQKEIKDALERMFHGKCAYCESQVTTTGYGDIEHFCPKRNPRCVNLTFEWSNLLLSCEKCNDAGHKGTQFPIDSNGNPLLIDPTDEETDINQHLDFSWDVVDGARVEGRDVRGKEVERIFDLNSDRGSRKELIKHRSARVKQILSLLKIAQQTANPDAIALLKEHCQPSAEYSAFALVHILPYLAHNFRDPEAIDLLREVSRRSTEYAAFALDRDLPSIS
ncbi:retron system putative HNH endonuclease [Argonema galeatum]|uniref:retron system putative HNH endonuclease n=1 Tax=Argonema galeatum TaxID=2942762 RepID=UPI002010EE8B|nr:retron system putative HNH endonuclease [Argonema galeatum]